MNFSTDNPILLRTDTLTGLSKLPSDYFDLVYVDPPWNTGQYISFRSEENKESSYRLFISQVLQQAHRILSKTGLMVFLSTPELHISFNRLINPVFDEENFRAEFIVSQKLNPLINSFQHSHFTVLIYSKTDQYNLKSTVRLTPQEFNSKFPLEEGERRFYLAPLTVRNQNDSRPHLSFDWREYKLPSNAVWRYNPEKLEELDAEGLIYHLPGSPLPKLKVFGEETSRRKVDTVWNDVQGYQYSKLHKIFTKTEEFVARTIELTTEENDIVCDVMARGCTTGIVSTNMNRRWVGIEDGVEIPLSSIAYRLHEYPSQEIEELPIVWDDYRNLTSREERVKQIIKEGETGTVEFKDAYCFNRHSNQKDKKLPDKIMTEVAAFFNSTRGGTIYLGVEDRSNTITGLSGDIACFRKGVDELETAILNKIKDSFGPRGSGLTRVKIFEIDGHHLGEIKVFSAGVPMFLNGHFHYRNGTQSVLVRNNQEFFDLLKQRNLLRRS